MEGCRPGSGTLLPGQAEVSAQPAHLNFEAAAGPRPESARDARGLHVVVPSDLHADFVGPGAERQLLLHDALAQLDGEDLPRDLAVEVLVEDGRAVHPYLDRAVAEVVLELDGESARRVGGH